MRLKKKAKYSILGTTYAHETTKCLSAIVLLLKSLDAKRSVLASMSDKTPGMHPYPLPHGTRRDA